MMILAYLVFGIYLISLLYVTIFCLMQLHLLYAYLRKNKGSDDLDVKVVSKEDLPSVTVQLPIFNEQYVVERLIDNIVLLDYPKDKLQIHILDDSTDDTLEITKRKVLEYKAKGYNIECITRVNRTGFKAGALRDSMVYATGELIAIFDADFMPRPDFLISTISHFNDPKIGVVQTRWEHLNQHHSLLTELQAMQLNVHFTIEQKGRYQAGYLLQFNGTAGLWRRTCIDDAGGWEADTLTEDLDLSYRAQMRGWEIMYLEDITAPAELPVEINGLKSQQYRWMKGGAETARKLLPKVWSSEISLRKKFQATVHLLASSIFIFVFIIGVFSVPLLFLIAEMSIDTSKFGVFMIALLCIIIVYFVGNVGVAWPRQNKAWMLLKFVLIFPIFLALSMGIAFHNSIAVIQGFLGRKSAFVRTPKYGVTTEKQRINKTKYFSGKLHWVTICEGLLSIYFFAAVYFGIIYDYKSFYAMHLLLGVGYFMLFYYAIQSRFAKS